MENSTQPLLIDESDIHKNIFDDCLRLLNKYLLIPSIPGNLLCATLVLLGLYKTSSHVVHWFVAMCTILLIRGLLYLVYVSKRDFYRLNFSLFFFGTALVALTWGYAGSLLMPAHDILHQSIIIIIIAGVTSGALQSLQANRWVSMTYIMLAIVPLTVWLYMQNTYIYILLGISMTTYCIFMLVACERGYAQLIETLKLHYENTNLIQHLSVTTQQLETSNNSLLVEVEERKKLENKYKELATHDTLTHLPNRAFMTHFLSASLNRAKRTNSKVAVLYADLDGFKQVNDTFGHDEGDKVLIKTADILRAHIRESDIVTRIGGDEFLIIMENIASAEAVIHKAEFLLQKLYQEFQPYEKYSSLAISIGISIFPDDGETDQLLIKYADIALYQAKQSGKNRVVLYHA